MPVFRSAEPHHVAAIARLWCEAFPSGRSVADRVRMLETGGRYGGLETVLVAIGREGELVGACKLYRMEERILGTAMPMMGLAAVAVAPAHRRRGIGARLCTEAVRRAALRGDVLSVLYPFRPDYYARLGWGLVGELHDYRFRTSHLPAYPEADRVRPAGHADRDAIAACYDRVACRANGPIRRDDTVWAYRLAGEEIGVRPVDPEAGTPTGERGSRRHAMVYEAGRGELTGYALLRDVRTRSRHDRRLQIRELMAETEDAYRGLLGYVARHADRWPLARHLARPEERFGDRLLDPRPPRHRPARSLYFPTCRVVRGPMLRVLDLPAALRLRPWYHGHRGRGPAALIRIRVDDPLAGGSQRPCDIRLDGTGGASVTGAEAPDGRGGKDRPAGTVEAELSTDASTFGRIYVGELPPTAAQRLGQAAIQGDATLLDRAFAARERFWLLDEF